MARKKGQNPEETRASILAASEDVFADKGFAASSMSEIAKAAGVTKSLIHHHFGSKTALWEEMKAARFQEFAAAQAQTITSPGDARQFARGAFTTYFRFLQRNPRFVRLMWWSQAEHGSSQHPEADDTTRSFAQQLAALGIERIRMMQKQGEMRDDLDARYLFAAYLGLLRHWFVARRDFKIDGYDERPEDLDDGYLEAIITIFLDGTLPAAAKRG